MAQSMDPLLDNTEEPVETGHLSRLISWLIVFSLLGILGSIYLISAAIKEQNKQVQADITQIDQALATISQPKPEQETLQNTLLELRQQINELEAFQTNLATEHINWPAVIGVIGNYGPSEITFTSLSQSGAQILINGQTDAEVVVMTYARMLEESGLFSRVVVQSIVLVMLPTPTPMPDQPDQATATPFPPIQAVQFVILAELNPPAEDSSE